MCPVGATVFGSRGTGACGLPGKAQERAIAVIPKATSHMFWLTVQKGAFDAGREFNVEILWNGPATETDFSRQIQIVDSMIAQRVDGIALAAAERNALVASVERAAAAHIPVTVFDSGLDRRSTSVMSLRITSRPAGRGASVDRVARREGQDRRGHACARKRIHDGSGTRIYGNHGCRRPGIQIVASQYGMSDRSKARAARRIS